MTCREKLKLEHPEFVGPQFCAGCFGCPHNYGYLPAPSGCQDSIASIGGCTACWDRELTAEKEIEALNELLIKDSGERRQFESGAVRDIREGKGRCDLMPLEVVARFLDDNDDQMLANIAMFQKSGDTVWLYHALEYACYALEKDDVIKCRASLMLDVSKHFEEGAKKYGENNWQKGIPVSCYIDSAVRHYLKWLRGDEDEPHDRAFVWNLMCCIWEVDYNSNKAEVWNG